MSLGGYKFAGYKCTKPSGATDAQWALLIHKTRLKAFMAANDAANAGWEFDWSNGNQDFTWESGGQTHSGDVIYYADGTDPLNLVSFFKHGSGDDTKYYMIASLFNYQLGTSYSGPTRINANGTFTLGYYTSSYQYKVTTNVCLFHTASYDRFPEDCFQFVSGGGTYPSRALSLVPISQFCYTSSAPYMTGSFSTNSYFAQTLLYLGVAIKGTNILTFTSANLTNDSDRYLRCKTTLVGFDGMTLSSPNDSANIYGITIYGTGDSDIRTISWTEYVDSRLNETLTDSFERYPVSNKQSQLLLSLPYKAVYNGSPDVYPFESVILTTNGERSTAPYLNNDGITSKGSFNVDLLACNGTYFYSNFDTWKTAANGNYIVVRFKRTTPSYATQPCVYYVGWDPSNPDITSEDAWTAYDGT